MRLYINLMIDWKEAGNNCQKVWHLQKTDVYSGDFWSTMLKLKSTSKVGLYLLALYQFIFCHIIYGLRIWESFAKTCHRHFIFASKAFIQNYSIHTAYTLFFNFNKWTLICIEFDHSTFFNQTFYFNCWL